MLLLGLLWGRIGSVRLLISVATLALFAVKGCGPAGPGLAPPSSARPAPGVVVRELSGGLGSVRVIDVDLTEPGIRLEVAAEDIALRGGAITGRARPLPDWLQATGAVAGVNGGFFGQSVGDDHRVIVGLLKRRGRVRVAAPRYRARGSRQQYARSALGFTRRGRPRMAWVTSRACEPQALVRHPQPEFTGPGEPWEVNQAVACGPRLIRAGQETVTYREERLASPGPLPRTFVGFGGPEGRPSRLVLCAADGMEFEDCARFLTEYFRDQHGMPCQEGMCLDGGASTQAAWKQDGGGSAEVEAAPDSGTPVPTAILVHYDPTTSARGLPSGSTR